MALLQAPTDIYKDLEPQEVPPYPQLPEDVVALKLVLKDLNLAEYTCSRRA